jgi:hypothetical protein
MAIDDAHQAAEAVEFR